jgi:uncharacterized protein (TIGR02996 family)
MDHDEAFIQDILEHPEDPSLRLIYADWLDERDDPRGQFLRLDVELAGVPRKEKKQRRQLGERLRQMREGIDRTWLARLDRTAVENCELQFDFECPKRWEKLTTTADPAVRFCDSCQQNVYHCGSVEQAERHAWAGHCVAVDSRTRRKPGDLRLLQQAVLGRIAPPRHLTRLQPGRRVRVTGGDYRGYEGELVRLGPGREGITADLRDGGDDRVRRVELRWDQFEVV